MVRSIFQWLFYVEASVFESLCIHGIECPRSRKYKYAYINSPCITLYLIMNIFSWFISCHSIIQKWIGIGFKMTELQSKWLLFVFFHEIGFCTKKALIGPAWRNVCNSQPPCRRCKRLDNWKLINQLMNLMNMMNIFA